MLTALCFVFFCALLFVGFLGKPHCKAASDTWNLLQSSGITALVNDDITGAALFFAALISGLIGAAGGAILARGPLDEPMWGLWALFSGLIAMGAVLIALEAPRASKRSKRISRQTNAWLPVITPSFRWSLLFGLCLFARLSASQSAAPFPSAAWIPVRATVNGQVVPDGAELAMWPLGRCNHRFVPVSASMARALAPAYNGTWREGADPADPDWTAGIALMMGGTSSWGEVPVDAWLLQTFTSEWAAKADWYKLSTLRGVGSTPPAEVVGRHSYSMQFSRARNELYIFGGASGESNLEDVWRFDLSAGGTWTQLHNPTDPDLHPSARLSSSTEWVLVPTAAATVQKLLFFSGHGAGVGSSVPSPNDLWAFDLSDAHTASNAASWSSPEGFGCGSAGRAAHCPDAYSLSELFPDLSVPLNQIIDQYATPHAPQVRPEDVADYANALLVLQTQLSDMLNTTKYLNYTHTHNLVDGPCSEWCLQVDASAAGPNRPTPREGHGMSLLDWTNPATGLASMQLVVFGGRILDCPSAATDTARGSSCYDPALYFLDLRTWSWSKRDPPLAAFLPGRTEPADFWPDRRAWHTQAIYYTPDGGAQLWIYAGHSYDTEGLATFKSDLAVFDFGSGRWFLQLPNRSRNPPQMPWPPEGYIDVQGQTGIGNTLEADAFRGTYDLHKDHMRGASWLVGDALWVHGGCTISPFPEFLAPISDEHGTLWALKLGATVHASKLRVYNDLPEWIFGQGVTHAQPGPQFLPDGSEGRYNYFYMTVMQNRGTNLTGLSQAEQQRIRQFNAALTGVPGTNSSVLPWWGPAMCWGTGLASRLEIQLISNVVTGGAVESGELISLFGNAGFPGETNFDSLYVARYSITEGSSYDVHVSFDGADVPGSPFLLNLETGPPSGWHSQPAGDARPLPPIQYDASGAIRTQHYGNMDIERPALWNGYGLSQVIREASGSFLIQIVDIHLVPWNDNSNAVHYRNDSVSSAVPFDAINVSLALIEVEGGASLYRLSLQEFHWINNEDGSYTVVYLPPWPLLSHRSELQLEVRVNDERIAQGSPFVVDVTDMLAPSDSLVVAVIVVLVFMMAMLFVLTCVVLREWPRQSLVSDSLVMFLVCMAGAVLLLITPLLMFPVSASGCRWYPPLLSCGFMLVLGSLVSMYLKHAWLTYAISQWAVKAQQLRPGDITMERALPSIPTVWPEVSEWRICGWLCVSFGLNFLLQCAWAGLAPLHVVRSPTVTRSPPTLFDHCDTLHSALLPKKVFVNGTLGIQAIVAVLALFFVSAVPVATHPYSRRNWTRVSIFHLCLIAFLATVALKVASEFDAPVSALIVQTMAVCWAVGVTTTCLLGPRVARWWRLRNTRLAHGSDSAVRPADDDLRMWIERVLAEQHAMCLAKALVTHRSLRRQEANATAEPGQGQREQTEQASEELPGTQHRAPSTIHARLAFAPRSLLLLCALAVSPVGAASGSSAPDSLSVSGVPVARSSDLYRYASVFFFSVACLTIMTAVDVILDFVQRSNPEDSASGRLAERKRAGYRRFYVPSTVAPSLVLRKSFLFCTEFQYFFLYCLNVCVSITLVCLQVSATSFSSDPYPSISLALFGVFIVMNFTIFIMPPLPEQSIDTSDHAHCNLETRRKIIAEGDTIGLEPQNKPVPSCVSVAQLQLYSNPWLWVALPRVYQLNILLAVPSFVAAAVSMASWNPSSPLAWVTLGYQLWNCHSLLLLTLGGGLLLLPYMEEVEESCKRAAGGGTCYRLVGPPEEGVYEKINSWNSTKFETEWIQPTHVPCTVGGRDMVERDSANRSLLSQCRLRYSFRLLNSWPASPIAVGGLSSSDGLSEFRPCPEFSQSVAEDVSAERKAAGRAALLSAVSHGSVEVELDNDD